VRGHYKATEHAISDLKKAREYLLAGKQYYDNAEELVMHAKAKLRLEEKVRQWSRTRGPWLVVYLIVWLMLLSASSLIIPRAEQIALDFGVPSWLAATILPGLFGGLGGVVGALWVLIKHIVIKRDFDPIHTTWYVVNPFMGITLGVMTYLIVYTGGVLGNLIVASDTNLTVTTGATPFMYALCVVVGFRQNVFWRLIDKFLSTIFPPSEDEESPVTETSSVTTPPSGAGGAG
jgi:hypothetical protein